MLYIYIDTLSNNGFQSIKLCLMQTPCSAPWRALYGTIHDNNYRHDKNAIQLLSSSSYYIRLMLTLPIISELLVTIYTAVLCTSLTGLVDILKCSPGNLLHHLPHHLWEVIVMAPPPVLPGTAVVQFPRPRVSWNGWSKHMSSLWDEGVKMLVQGAVEEERDNREIKGGEGKRVVRTFTPSLPHWHLPSTTTTGLV